MYGYARKRRLLTSLLRTPSLLSTTMTLRSVPVTSHSVPVTSPGLMTSQLHTTAGRRSIAERMAGVAKFQYEIIFPDNDGKPDVREL